MERNLHGDHSKSNAGQQRMKELATQLQKRHEEVTRQRQQVEERQHKCDEYEARLRSWEEQLEHVTKLVEGNGGGSRQHLHHDEENGGSEPWAMTSRDILYHICYIDFMFMLIVLLCEVTQ